MVFIGVNIFTGECFDNAGQLIADGYPRIPYGNTETVIFQCYDETPSGKNISEWKKSAFTGSGYSALCSSDNNFRHWINGTLMTAAIGLITEISVKTDIKPSDTPDVGTLVLYAANGDEERVTYSDKIKIEGGYRFIVNTTLINSYAVGDSCDMPEQLFFSAAMDSTLSQVYTGKFGFVVSCYSTKLRDAQNASNEREIPDVVGLELLVTQWVNNVQLDRFRQLVPEFSIPSGVAAIDQHAQEVPQITSTIVVAVNELLSLGYDVEYSPNGNTDWVVFQRDTDNYYRYRLNGSNAPWEVVKMPRGGGLKIDKWGLLSERPTSAANNFCYYATDTGMAYIWGSQGFGGSWSDGIKIQGEIGPIGPAVAYNPVLAAGTVADANYGRVAYLGSDIDIMTAFDPQYDVSRVVLRLVSANAAITGNIVLVPIVNGVDGAAVVVPVGATVAPVELALVCNGKLSIRRDWQDARDTLRDGVPVTAIVVAWEVHHG